MKISPTIKTHLLPLAAILLSCTFQLRSSEPPLDIIPAPAESSVHEGKCTIGRGDVIGASSGLYREAEYLRDYCDTFLGFELGITDKASPKARICLTLDRQLEPEGYHLNIGENGISIAGGSAAGAFYGIQTLIQLLPTSQGVVPELPFCKISDSPRFKYRGAHLDVSRHFFTVSFIKRYIDMLAYHKMNYFHWHLTDDHGWRIEIKSHPELTGTGSFRNGEIEGLYPGKYRPRPYRAYYTQEQAAEIVDYAARRHITVVPEFDIPGHCMAVLACYPEMSTQPDSIRQCALTWGVFNKMNNVLAPTEKTFQLIKDVFSELCGIFPGKYIHLGGDECAFKWWKESETAQKYIKENGLSDESELQSHFVHYAQDVIESYGKTAIGWSDVLSGNISRRCVIQNWREKWHDEDMALKSLRSGHQTIMSSGKYAYFNRVESNHTNELGHSSPTSVKDVYHYRIVPEGATPEEEKLVLGFEACMWTEYFQTGKKIERFMLPRLTALAENGWSSPDNKSWESFVDRLMTQLDRFDLWNYDYSRQILLQEDRIRKDLK